MAAWARTASRPAPLVLLALPLLGLARLLPGTGVGLWLAPETAHAPVDEPTPADTDMAKAVA